MIVFIVDSMSNLFCLLPSLNVKAVLSGLKSKC